MHRRKSKTSAEMCEGASGVQDRILKLSFANKRSADATENAAKVCKRQGNTNIKQHLSPERSQPHLNTCLLLELLELDDELDDDGLLELDDELDEDERLLELLELDDERLWHADRHEEKVLSIRLCPGKVNTASKAS